MPQKKNVHVFVASSDMLPDEVYQTLREHIEMFSSSQPPVLAPEPVDGFFTPYMQQCLDTLIAASIADEVVEVDFPEYEHQENDVAVLLISCDLPEAVAYEGYASLELRQAMMLLFARMTSDTVTYEFASFGIGKNKQVYWLITTAVSPFVSIQEDLMTVLINYAMETCNKEMLKSLLRFVMQASYFDMVKFMEQQQKEKLSHLQA